MTYCRNATLGLRDFYRLLCHTLGLQPTSSAANRFLAVETHMHDLLRYRIHPVFLLDEAHLLHTDMLAHLHILLNMRREALKRPGPLEVPLTWVELGQEAPSRPPAVAPRTADTLRAFSSVASIALSQKPRP